VQEEKTLANQTELWEILAVPRYRHLPIDAVLFATPRGWLVGSTKCR
jgi:hypothetical protein